MEKILQIIARCTGKETCTFRAHSTDQFVLLRHGILSAVSDSLLEEAGLHTLYHLPAAVVSHFTFSLLHIQSFAGAKMIKITNFFFFCLKDNRFSDHSVRRKGQEEWLGIKSLTPQI